MTAPITPPHKPFDFTSFSQNQPDAQLPGQQVDIALDDLRASITSIIKALDAIIAADGSLIANYAAPAPATTGGVLLSKHKGKVTARVPSPVKVPSNVAGHVYTDAERAGLYMDLAEYWAEHMPDKIPPDRLAEMGITGDHWSSRWWAHDAHTHADAAHHWADYIKDFVERYLGSHLSDPTTGHKGGPLLDGSLYYNSITNALRVYDGGVWQDVQDSYRTFISTTPPTSDPDGRPLKAGQMYFDPIKLEFYVYDGNAWQNAGGPGTIVNATQGRFDFTATGGEASIPADYTSPYVDVFVNGIRLTKDQDFTLDGTNVVFTGPLRSGDIVNIVPYKVFAIASVAAANAAQVKALLLANPDTHVLTDALLKKLTELGFDRLRVVQASVFTSLIGTGTIEAAIASNYGSIFGELPYQNDLVVVENGGGSEADWNGTYAMIAPVAPATAWTAKKLAGGDSKGVGAVIKALASDADPDTTVLPEGTAIYTIENLKKQLRVVTATGGVATIYDEDYVKQLIAAGSLFQGAIQDEASLSALPVPATGNRGFYWTWTASSNYLVGPTSGQIATDLAGRILQIGDWVQSDGARWVHVPGDLLSKARWDKLGAFVEWSDGGWEQGALVVHRASASAPLRYYRATSAVKAGDPAPGAVGAPWVNIAPEYLLDNLLDVDGAIASADGNILQYNAAAGEWKKVDPKRNLLKLEDLKDIDVAHVFETGQGLLWDDASKTWKPQFLVTETRAGVAIDTLAMGFDGRSFVERVSSAPPAAAVEWDAYIVGATPTGVWAGFSENSIAVYSMTFDNGLYWNEVAPKANEIRWVKADQHFVMWNATTSKWEEVKLGGDAGIGVYVSTKPYPKNTVVLYNDNLWEATVDITPGLEPKPGAVDVVSGTSVSSDLGGSMTVLAEQRGGTPILEAIDHEALPAKNKGYRLQIDDTNLLPYTVAAGPFAGVVLTQNQYWVISTGDAAYGKAGWHLEPDKAAGVGWSSQALWSAPKGGYDVNPWKLLTESLPPGTEDGQALVWDTTVNKWVLKHITSPIVYLGEGDFNIANIGNAGQLYGMPVGTTPDPTNYPPLPGDQFLSLTSGKVTVFLGDAGTRGAGGTSRRDPGLVTGASQVGTIRLEDLENVAADPAADGQVLTFNATTNLWVPKTPAASASASKASLWIVGDIKQSWLTETEFVNEMGVSEAGKWVLADGRNVTGTKFATITGLTKVPDLRGGYLRPAGQNGNSIATWNGGPHRGYQGQQTARPGTPFTTSDNGDHNHSISMYSYGFQGGNSLGLYDYHNTPSMKYTNNSGAHHHTITGGGDPETRPNSWSVNTFIKVND